MKSGLKDALTSREIECSNHCRDEKRTERAVEVSRNGLRCVATIAAMKSGLKVTRGSGTATIAAIKTESSLRITLRSNHCRDEKRTESVYWIIRHTQLGCSSNHCPDEKRTESQRKLVNHQRASVIVATIAAMKSGLKVTM